jgi:hypothetical protein
MLAREVTARSYGWCVGQWDETAEGVLRLPSERLIRGRGVGHGLPIGALPEFSVFLLRDRRPPVAWDERWVRWPDFRLPADRDDARAALREAWQRCAAERVEVACLGGRGRTGTALACVAVLDGVPSADAVDFVRRNYHPRAVETRGQRRFVAHFER